MFPTDMAFNGEPMGRTHPNDRLEINGQLIVINGGITLIKVLMVL